jgi:hypothetical protein
VIFKVEVTPLQTQDFADAKSRALGHHHHRAVWFSTTLDDYVYTPDDTIVEGEVEPTQFTLPKKLEIL